MITTPALRIAAIGCSLLTASLGFADESADQLRVQAALASAMCNEPIQAGSLDFRLVPPVTSAVATPRDPATTATTRFEFDGGGAPAVSLGMLADEPAALPPGKAAGGNSADDLAKKSQNPVANLISVPFQNNINFGLDPGNKAQNILNIQPVIPFELGKEWNLITRTILPVVYQPSFSNLTSDEFGLGDINTTLFLSPASESKLTWGLGPVLSFPTATASVLGTGKFSLGPSAVLVYSDGPWVLGVLANNVWSVAGNSDRTDVNSMLVQYFVNYNFGGGWYVNSAPIITANWKAPSDNAWVIPFGGGVGRVFRIGEQPVNLGVQAYYNAVRPDNAADWQLRVQLTFLFPK